MNNNVSAWYRRKHDLTPEEVQRLDTFRQWDAPRITKLLNIIKTFTEMACRICPPRKNGKIIATLTKKDVNI